MMTAEPIVGPDSSNLDALGRPNGEPVVNPSPQQVSVTRPTCLPSAVGAYLPQKLDDAELLLGYAAEMGLEVENTVRQNVLRARTACDGGGITEEIAANLLTALTVLAVRVRPVTVESLEAWIKSKGNGDRPTARSYKIPAIVVGSLVLFISVVTFVSSRVAESIKTDVDTANALAAKLALELGPPPPTNQSLTLGSTRAELADPAPTDIIWFGPNGPPRGVSDKDVITDLQKFAATMREIDANSRQLNHFVFDATHVPFSNLRTNWPVLKQKLELTPGLPLLLAREFGDKLGVYQEVRNFANTVCGMTSVYYGAIAAYILPVLYALLGAAAYLLRLYDDQVRNRTFVEGDKHLARFFIAGIGGLVVGQFNVAPGVAISPFAVAFLAGYAVDLFFAFLDTLLQVFKRNANNGGSQSLPLNAGK